MSEQRPQSDTQTTLKATESRIHWPNILFLTLTPLGALAGLVWWFASGSFNWGTVGLTAFMAGATGLGITAGYHRLYAHRSYEATWPVRLWMLLFGGASFEGSALEWCLDHRKHHNHIDTERDPYNINQGFWHAHILWLFRRPTRPENPQARDLQRDPLVRFQDRYYLPLAVLICFGLPAALAGLWGDALGGLLIAGLARLVVNQHATFAINSVCHKFGEQTYSDNHTARDNWVTALLTYGEGYHNYHHEFPGDYRNGIRFYHWDPTKWTICLLSRLGLARNLNEVPVETVVLKRLAQQEKTLAGKLRGRSQAFLEFAEDLLHRLDSYVQDGARRLRELRRQYYQTRKSQREVEPLRALRRQLKQAEREFHEAVALWEATFRKLDRLASVTG